MSVAQAVALYKKMLIYQAQPHLTKVVGNHGLTGPCSGRVSDQVQAWAENSNSKWVLLVWLQKHIDLRCYQFCSRLGCSCMNRCIKPVPLQLVQYIVYCGNDCEWEGSQTITQEGTVTKWIDTKPSYNKQNFKIFISFQSKNPEWKTSPRKNCNNKEYKPTSLFRMAVKAVQLKLGCKLFILLNQTHLFQDIHKTKTIWKKKNRSWSLLSWCSVENFLFHNEYGHHLYLNTRPALLLFPIGSAFHIMIFSQNLFS